MDTQHLMSRVERVSSDYDLEPRWRHLPTNKTHSCRSIWLIRLLSQGCKLLQLRSRVYRPWHVIIWSPSSTVYKQNVPFHSESIVKNKLFMSYLRLPPVVPLVWPQISRLCFPTMAAV
jgi:hypothetical protein